MQGSVRRPSAPAQTVALFRHAVYGLVIDSDFALGSLPPALDASAAADIRLLRAAPGYFDSEALRRRYREQSSGTWYRHAALTDGGVFLAVPGVLQAEVSADGGTALCAPAPEGDRRAFEANVLNFVLSIALTLKGEEPLHATVVQKDGRAIAFLGDSGSGKSTLAAFLLSQGAALVTDDILRVGFVGDKPIVHRGPLRVKLFDEQARLLLPAAARDAAFNPMSGKLLVEAAAHPANDDGPVRLAALFWLDDAAPTPSDPSVSVRRMHGLETARILLASTLHRDHRTAERTSRQLREIGRLATAVPLFAVGYPRRHELLPSVAGAIAAAVAR
jgi:hypothetical protein